MSKKKYCVVTGSRADYGLLYWVMKGIQAEPGMELQVAVTGMHLSPEYGLTVQQIERDGFPISATVETLISSDSGVGAAKSVGLGVIGFADAFSRLLPDMIIVLGDRFEILAAVEAALFARVPVAHLAGGDLTEGSIDDAMRHAITKMAHLHFATNAEAARRIAQLGEDAARIFQVGSPGIDTIRQTPLLARDELEAQLDFKLQPRNLLVTFHPPTMSGMSAADQFEEVLTALSRLDPNIGLIFTRPNADMAGRQLAGMLDRFVAQRRHAVAFASLGQVRYLSLIAQVDAVVGNSSSGLYEVPSLKKPTVNIGDRQDGRLRASSVIDCAVNADRILAAIEAATVMDCRATVNPYGDGDSSRRILATLKAITEPERLLMKSFCDLPRHD